METGVNITSFLCEIFISTWKIAKAGLDRPNEVAMAIEAGHLSPCGMIENANRVVATATDDAPPVRLDTSYAFVVTRKRLDTRASA